MPNQLIELQDEFLVEVEVPPDQVRQISGGLPEQVDESINAVHTLLLKACRPVVSVWSELNKEMSISGAEIELQLGFSAQGSVFGAGSNPLIYRISFDIMLSH